MIDYLSKYYDFHIKKPEKKEKQKVLLLGDGFFARGFKSEIDYNKYSLTQIYQDSFINPQDIFYSLQRGQQYVKPFNFNDKIYDIFNKKKIEKIQENIISLQINNQSAIINNKIYVYDYLVIGLGADKSLKSWSDELNNIIIKPRMNLAIIGTGPVGLELSLILNKFHNVDIFDILSLDKILSYVKPYHKKYILGQLEKNNINLSLGDFYSQEKWNHDKLIYCVGSKANRLSANYKVNDNLQLESHNNVYVGGDCATTKYIKNAQVAYQQGVYVARRLNGSISNDVAFSFKSKGISLNVDDQQVLIENHGILMDGIYPDFMIKLYSMFCV